MKSVKLSNKLKRYVILSAAKKFVLRVLLSFMCFNHASFSFNNKELAGSAVKLL